MEQKQKKQSIIYGALAGTVGIFITKALGLLYASPFHAMAGDQLVFYTYTYQIYDFLWSISTSGIPFAIASLVAKNMATKDYQLALKIRKLSILILVILGSVVFLSIALLSSPISQHFAQGRPFDYQHKYQVCLLIMSFACVSVPILNGYRSFYQGIKEFEIYSFSQILEQFVRVVFLLAAGAIAVYVFHQEAIWAVYFAIAAMSIAAIATILYFKKLDQKHLPMIRQLANEQEVPNTQSNSDILKSILIFALPFLLQGILDNSFNLINLAIVPNALVRYGYHPVEADNIYSIMNFSVYKISSIPMVIGMGVAMAIIPHLSEAKALHNYKKIDSDFWKGFTSSGFVSIPLIVLMACLAKEVYFVMYGSRDLDLGAEILRLEMLQFSAWILIYISNYILLSLDLRWQSLMLFAIRLFVMLFTTRFVVERFAYTGLYLLTFAVFVLFAAFDWIIVKRTYAVRLMPTIHVLFLELICCIPTVLWVWIFHLITPNIIEKGRIVTFLVGMGVGIIGALLYLVMAYLMKIPQTVFHIDLDTVKQKLSSVFHR